MNLKERIQTMRKALAEFTSQFKFADYKTPDGTIVRIDGDAVAGTLVYVLDEAGNVLPAPDGEHILPDLGTIVVESGALVSVAPVAAEAPVVEEALADPAEAAAAVEEVAAVVETIAPELPAEEAASLATDVVAELQEKVLELQGVVAEMKKKMDSMGAATATANAAFASAIEELAGMPSAPAKTAISGVIETAKKSESDKFSAVAENLRKMQTLKK